MDDDKHEFSDAELKERLRYLRIWSEKAAFDMLKSVILLERKKAEEQSRASEREIFSKLCDVMVKDAYKKGQNDLIAEIDKLIQNPKPEKPKAGYLESEKMVEDSP